VRALITGLGGFVASHLAEYLITNTDWEIYGTMRWQESTDNLQSLIPWINEGNRVHVVYADLNDAGSMNAAVNEAKPDYVFHLAAQSYPLTSFTIPAETMATNVGGTLNLLEALKDSKAWIHICSSSEVYGRVSQEQLPITEETAFSPASPYAVSKVATDHLGQLYAAYGMNIVVSRMFTHTGPRRGDVFSESSFAKQIAMIEAGQIEPVVKVGNLNSLRTIADVRDAVRAYHMMLTVNPVSGEAYNIGGNHTCTVGDILKHLIGDKDIDVMVEAARLRPIDADLQVPNCDKFRNQTGWEPIIPFVKTMDDLLEYWRNRVRNGSYMTR
jgi:GDP-mannose 4,6-dehydratase